MIQVWRGQQLWVVKSLGDSFAPIRHTVAVGIAKAHDFVAQEGHHDVLAAVDLVMDKLQGQLRRYKEKLQDRRRTPSAGEAARAKGRDEAGGQ